MTTRTHGLLGRSAGVAAALAAAMAISVSAGALQTTIRFYADDPLDREPESQDASNVRSWEISDEFEQFENSVRSPGDQSDIRALSINTLDEVPDSAWFTNRLGWEVKTAPPVQQAPAANGPAPGRLTIVEGKSAGIQPGFVVDDERGQRFFLKFDPPSNPEMASGAEVISTKVFHAFGYNVPENVVARVQPDMLVIGEGATSRRDGRTYRFTHRDLDDILARAARAADGSYRALASKAIAGQAIGPFRYYGTRPDDPNDIFPHEHRRELRGMRVLAAWLNHHDVKSNNSLDTLVDANGRKVVRHHVLDFGATLGSGSIEAQKRRAGNEFLWEARPTLITMLTLGLYVRPWIKLDYPDIPAVGRIEGDYFDPENWKPDFPNPAFENARPDDTFWAARRVAAFTDDVIRSIVRTAEFSDPEADRFLTEVIIKRRDKILHRWLTAINPVVDFAIDQRGALTFRNAAVEARVASAPSQYTVRWAGFDNRTGSADALSEPTPAQTPRFDVPATLTANADYLVAEISAAHQEYPSWLRPTRVHFRRDGSAWRVIGVQREP